MSNIQQTNTYTYANDIHLQMTASQTTSSKGESLTINYLYPHDITTGDLASTASALQFQGRKAELLQIETFRGTTLVAKTQNFFDFFNSVLLPSHQKTFIGGSSVPTESFQLSYGLYGNLTSFKEEAKGTPHSFMWGYNGQYPVVYVANGVPSDLSALETTTDASTIENTANTLRTTLPDAHISSYSFQQMIGLLSQTAPNGIKTSFAYDGLNRLDKTTDQNGDILKAYNYHIATFAGDNNVVTESLPRIASSTLPTSYQEVKTILSYVDGLGRPLQTVEKNAGGNGTNDIVNNAKTYDGFGRIAKSYINYSNAGNGALAPLPSSFDGDTHPYSENILFDNSPLNRLFQVQGVGQAWATANKQTRIYTEVSGGIRSYTVASDGSVSSSTYPANSLYKTTFTNEQGNNTTEYKDKEGRTIQKEQELNATETAKTAYIYNDLGQLAYVVQPLVYDAASSFNQNSSSFLEGIFGYLYDAKGRLVEKHIPGGGWTRMVYDQLNRIVLENDDKDANESTNYYKFTRYDAFSRVIQTGLTFGIGGFNRQDLQNNFDNLTQINESRTSTGGILGYTNGSFPYDYTPVEANFRTVTYYDNYAWNNDNAYNFQSGNAFHTQQLNVKGMITGALVRNLETNAWLKNVMYFEYQGRVIQSFNQNHLGGIDRSEYNYRFNSEVLKMRMVHLGGTPQNITEIYEYAYDHAGRKTSFTHNNKVVAKYEYDGIGRLQTKKLQPAGSSITSNQSGNWTDVNTWLSGILPTLSDRVTIESGHTVTIPSGQSVSAGSLAQRGTLQNNGILNMGTLTSTSSDLQTLDYKYHIRGGLQGINVDANNSFIANRLFNVFLGYEADTHYFDGNIRNQVWKTAVDEQVRQYLYDYDQASRITQGAFTSTLSGENYSLNNVGYDLNSNITTLIRTGYKSNGTFGMVDNLGYTYNTNSNKILKVDDASNESASFKDATGATDYTYYPDGSLKSDANKGINLIEYNYLKSKVKLLSQTAKLLAINMMLLVRN